MSAAPVPFKPGPVPMYNPDDNTTRIVPPERIDEATAAGWEHASKMISPQGGSQWIPVSRMDEASKAGYSPYGPPKPSVNMQSMPGTESLITPAHGAGSLGPGQPEATPGMGTAGAVGITAGAAAETLPALLPHLVKAAQHPAVRELLKKGLEKSADAAVGGAAGTGAYLLIRKALGLK